MQTRCQKINYILINAIWFSVYQVGGGRDYVALFRGGVLLHVRELSLSGVVDA
jgi:hypothetical protein